MERITSVTVTYENGTTETWTGNGSIINQRTPTAAGKTPVSRDDDVSFVQAVLVYTRPEH